MMNLFMALFIFTLSGVAFAATATSQINQPSVQCVDLETNTVVKEAAVETKTEGEQVVLFDRSPGGAPAQEIKAAETTTVVAETPKVRKVAKRKIASVEMSTTEKALVVKPKGSGVVDVIPAEESSVRVVPVAKPGYISGVTETGEVVMIPIGTTSPKVVTSMRKDLHSGLEVTGRSFINSKGQAQVVVPKADPGFISGVTAAGEIVLIPLPVAKTDLKKSTLVASTETTMAPAPATPAPVVSETTIEQEVKTSEVMTAPAQASSQTRVIKYTTVPAKRAYAALITGVGAYPEVSNVDPGYDITGAFGYYYKDYIFEAGGSWAQYKMGVTNYTISNRTDDFDINQYQAHFAAKYMFAKGTAGLSHRLQPIAGTLLTYTRRDYNLTNPIIAATTTTGDSSAIDAGLTAGVDYEFNPSFALGIDFKYMFNLTHQVNANYANSGFGYVGTPIERLQRYVAGVSAKVSF